MTNANIRFTCQTATRTQTLVLAARCVRALRLVPPSQAEGAGNAGCWPHPRALRAKEMHFCARKQTGQPKQPASPAQWFTAYSALSSVSRASLPPSSADVVIRELDPSIAGSGPHAFAVRDAGARLAPSVASTASRRNVRDVRTPLLSGGTGKLIEVICPTG